MRNAGLSNAGLRKRSEKPKVKIIRARLLRESAAVKRYRKLTGKKRLTMEERSAISMFGAARTARRLNMKAEEGRDLFEKRISRYEKLYGTASPEAVWGLQYGGADYVRKVLYGDAWKRFTQVKFPDMTWYELPGILRQGSGRERFDDLIYHTEVYWDGDNRHDRVSRLIEGAWKDDAVVLDEAIRLICEASGDVLFDPGNTGDFFLVYRSEWAAAKELASDYTTSRKYR